MWMLPAIASLPRAVLRFSFMLAVLGLAVNAAHSQNSTGSLRGIVEDASRGRIRGARVVVREAESSRERSAASDSRGEFRLDNLLPGFYRVMVSAQGFAEAQSVVAIEVSSVCEISITLGPASLQQGVSVQGSASSITTQPIETSSAVHQNFSTDAIQEFAVRTAQEDADTGRTTAGSVVITTKRGTDQLHGDLAFYERAADLNARFPIDNPPPNPKQPFSRQNDIGTLGGAVKPGKLWFFGSFEYVNERASIAYSVASTTQFHALAQLAAMGLIPGVNSIDVPSSVPVPFGDALGSIRLDWAESSKSQWFLRAASDRYTTRNDLVQENTLPSTGTTSRSSYLNLL